jgi:hypothetical protein
MTAMVEVTVAIPAEVLLHTDLYRSGAGLTVQCAKCRPQVARWTFAGHTDLSEILSKVLAHHNAFHGGGS